ncbi:MAG: membrane protein insertase YidC, partial [Polyangiaceae bacterium]|nr:membrane protein insertase YidC [Polyangiaceae bacterium]
AVSAVLETGDTLDEIVLGGDSHRLRVTLTPLGGAIASIQLVERDSGGRYVYRAAADSQEPAQVLRPVLDGSGAVHASFATHRVWVPELGRPEGWRMDDLVWRVAESGPQHVVFSTTLAGADGAAPLLRITKRFELLPDKPLLHFTLEATNLAGRSLSVQFAQDGPIGIHREHAQYDMRYLMTAARHKDQIELSTAEKRDSLLKAARSGKPVTLFTIGTDKTFLWAALGNKFFGVFTRPLPPENGRPAVIQTALGTVAAPNVDTNHSDWTTNGDLLARLVTTRDTLAESGGSARYAFEIYAGPKDSDVLKRVNAAYVDQDQLGYSLFHGADLRCFCVPLWLTQLMTWLLQSIQALVFNGGAAIIVLVIIVRTLLHPLAVFQQKSMYKMQEGMLKLQPKLEAIKEKYPDDKVKQNQETMRLYSEEGVNPMAGLVGMLPLFIQMPILGALWTALNTDIHLRHAPLDGWWIRDLSAPDALLPFNPPIDLPVLSWLPFIGYAFSGVTALNLLPLLMGVSMWLQQKYMPKPAMQARLEAARKQQQQEGAAPRRSGGGMTPEEQLRQQQMMAYMMSVMFPLMFYYMPAGLNLYWMATNVFGICESLIIRRQLERDRERREREGDIGNEARNSVHKQNLLTIASNAGAIPREVARAVQFSGSRPPSPRTPLASKSSHIPS